MARVPTPYDRDDEVPVTLLTFRRGSNNSTRATTRLLEYENGDLCLQLEDQISGGEMWMDEDDFVDYVEQLNHVLDDLLRRRHGRDTGE